MYSALMAADVVNIAGELSTAEWFVFGFITILFTTVSSFVLKSTRELKKDYRASNELIKEQYIGILNQKQASVDRILDQKEKDIEDQKRFYENVISYRMTNMLHPMEQKLKDAENEMREMRGIIKEMQKEAEYRNAQISDLKRFEELYKTANDYIDALVDALYEEGVSIPHIPLSLRNDVIKARKNRLADQENRDNNRKETD